jgi:hypothetical protein
MILPRAARARTARDEARTERLECSMELAIGREDTHSGAGREHTQNGICTLAVRDQCEKRSADRVSIYVFAPLRA